MNKIKYIIKREYLVRIRKKAFWILTLLGPLLYAFLISLPIISKNAMTPEVQTIYVIDKSELFNEKFEDSEEVVYHYMKPGEKESIEKLLEVQENSHLLYIPELDIDDPEGFALTSGKNAGLQLISSIKIQIENIIRDMRIIKLGLDKEVLKNIDPRISINTMKITGEKKNVIAANGVAWLAGFLNYFFIFLYGSLVLRGVQEEKSNRIIEIMVSSVRPFSLMFGKIIGIALVGLTQFILWILLTVAFSSIAIMILGTPDATGMGGLDRSMVLSIFEGVNFPLIIGAFVFYFIGGYLLYSSLFASIAAAVDNQTDMQQFMFPVSIPLIIAIVFISFVTEAPHSSLSIWLSMIPFTSPIIMIGRIAFDVPLIELLSSMLLLIAGFVFTTWIASKIYRIGILMYGKKVTYKEIGKWLFYK